MPRPIEEPTPLDLAAALADDDIAREYEKLSDMEDLGALAPPSGGEGALLEDREALAHWRDDARSRELPDDAIDSAAEWIGG